MKKPMILLINGNPNSGRETYANLVRKRNCSTSVYMMYTAVNKILSILFSEAEIRNNAECPYKTKEYQDKVYDMINTISPTCLVDNTIKWIEGLYHNCIVIPDIKTEDEAIAIHKAFGSRVIGLTITRPDCSNTDLIDWNKIGIKNYLIDNVLPLKIYDMQIEETHEKIVQEYYQ